MQIYIRSMKYGRVAVEVNAKDTINEVKMKLEDKIGVPKRFQKLVFAGQELSNENTLEFYWIEDGNLIDLIRSISLVIEIRKPSPTPASTVTATS